MRRPQHPISITDLFCGAGGSSIGAEAAGGRLVMAANHWALACETHQSNFPHADHDVADISQVRPQRYPTTDILIASPECTNHSLAKGRSRAAHRGQLGLPGIALEEPVAAERSRATMWDVPRFAEVHRYPLIVIENVVDARDWVMYPAWLMAMEALGYEHREVFLNSMVVNAGDWGAPQSRDRLYVCFWRKGMRRPELDHRPASWCYWCETEVEGIQTWKNPQRRWGRYRAQYIYTCPCCHRQVAPLVYPAARAIDWSILGQRIGDRRRPLAPATLERIWQGIAKYWGHDLVVPLDRLRESKVPGPIDLPLATLTARADKGLVGLPFLAEMHGTSGVRGVAEPVLAVTTGGNHHGLCEPPLYVKCYGGADKAGPMAHPVGEPLGVMTATDHHALLVGYNGRPDTARPVSEPASTVMLEPHHGLLVPAGGTWRDGAVPTSEPIPARTAAENDGLLVPVSGNVFAQGSYTRVRSTREPFVTQTADRDKALLTMPYNRTGQPRPVDRPVTTLTAIEGQSLIEGRPEIEDCTFRMLEPHEIGAAMAFPASYEVKGTKRDRVRQYGNAVTPPVMRWLVGQAVESLR